MSNVFHIDQQKITTHLGEIVRCTDINNLTPLQAINLLQTIKEELENR